MFWRFKVVFFFIIIGVVLIIWGLNNRQTDERRIFSTMNFSLDNHHHSIAMTFNPGRLGNQLSSFASLYSVWREFKIYNYISEKQWILLDSVFDLPTRNNNVLESKSAGWPYFIWTKGNHTFIKIYSKFY